jgi:glucose/arabinose dehydrogenase
MLKVGGPVLIVVVLLGLAVFYLMRTQTSSILPAPSPLVNNANSSLGSTATSTAKNDSAVMEVVAQDLEVPWALAFLPDGSLIFTERVGRVSLLKLGQQAELIIQINEVRQLGEGGLLGVAVDPEFSKNSFIYVYYTYGSSGNNSLNRVVRYSFRDKKMVEPKTIVEAIPGAQNHDGGRLKFGVDGFLYITTGDALEPSLAQDTSSLAGKILRVTRDGTAAPGNPFNSAVYSYGHRNPQGISWDDQGRLWETEHGNSQFDEVNLIEMGKNYGWPVIQGSQSRDGMLQPKLFAEGTTWAPSGLAFVNGSLFFSGLRGQALFEAKLEGDKLSLVQHFQGQLGRIRESVLGPDGMLYITTNNRDGRGTPRSGDDQIIRVNLGKL